MQRFRLLIATITLALVAGACSPMEIAIFNSLSPADQNKVLAPDAIQQAFGDLGPGVVAQATRVAQCESEMDPRALNGNPAYQAAGLFQVIKQWATSYKAVTGAPYYDDRFNPYANATFARYLYNDGARQGDPWKHWACKP